jgi:hypothetical protein
MNITIESIKKNMAALSFVVTFATVMIGGAFAIDHTYARADSVNDLKSYVQQQHEYDRWQNQQGMSKAHQQQIEDQLFILRLKPNPTTADKALIQRYEDELKQSILESNVPAPPAPQ